MKDSLRDRVVLVSGVTGNVGWGAAWAFLEAGATVIAPTRSAARGEALTADFPGQHLHVAVTDLSAPGNAEALRDRIYARFGRLDHAVVCIGPWWQKGPIVAQSLDELQQVMRVYVESQFLVARAFLPFMGRGNSYTIVTGAAGEASLPNTGLLVTAVQGLYGLSRMLRVEHQSTGVRVNELRIHLRIARAPRLGVLPARQAGPIFVNIARSAEVDGALIRLRQPEDVQDLNLI